MKYLLIIVCSFLTACYFTSCASSEQTVKANKIIMTALDFSVRHGIVSEKDAESAKEINNIVLPAKLPEVTIETTSGK